MTDPWQDYLTALTGLTGLADRLSARRRQAENQLKTDLTRAEHEPQRVRAELDGVRRTVESATTVLERVRLALGVEIAGQTPAHSINAIDQAEAAAVAATQWADQAEAKLASLRRSEQRLAHTPAFTPPSAQPVPTISNRSPRALLGILAVVLVLVLAGVVVFILG